MRTLVDAMIAQVDIERDAGRISTGVIFRRAEV
jgi:hypothetical protein